MKKIIYAVIICSAVGLTACATKTGYEPRVSANETDGSRQVLIVPHAACTGAAERCPLSVGVSWSSKQPDEATLNIVLASEKTGVKELQIDIDGSKISLHPDQTAKLESINSAQHARLSFKTKLSVVKYIVESKNTSIKAITTDGTSIEAPIIEAGHDTYAFNALKRFLLRV